ncbi:MAG: hypothetical protein AAGA77_21265 [Bacteroidota bacterium]
MRSSVIFVFAHVFVIMCSFGQEELVNNYEEEEYEEISRVYFAEANFSIYSPLDAFSEKIERNTLYGFSLGFLMQLQKEKPSFIGVEVFHLHLGMYSSDYEAVIGSEQLILSGRVSSNNLGINLNYRYYLPFKVSRIEPYLEGQLGVKWMYSYLTESGSFSDGEEYNNFDFLTGTWVLSYGGALGFQIHLTDVYYLNLKSSYHFAVSGEYERRIQENLDAVEFPQEAFETVQSSTNFVKFDLGLTFLF